jgi:hypothetical protein
MKTAPRYAVALAAVAALLLASCSQSSGPTQPVTALAPGATPAPGVTASPGVAPAPGFTASPGPGVTPLPPGVLSCAQNAITGLGVPLGTDAGFAVLAASTVTNSGPTTVTGDLGISPGTALTGFGAGGGVVVGGTTHVGDPTAAQAQLDLTAAYNNAAARVNPSAIPADIAAWSSRRASTKRPCHWGSPGTSRSTVRTTPTASLSSRRLRP